MNRHSVAAALALGAVLVATSGCSPDETDDPGSRDPRTAEPNVPEVVRTSLIDVRARDLPRAPRLTALPRSLPDPASMPALLDDLPGRATLALNAEFNDVTIDWSEITLIFFGRDGRWRRLDLEDLGLPDDTTYLDTYGAGDLSPDGRYWIGPTRDGVVLLDLGTGEVDQLSTPGGGRWAPGRGTIVTRRSEIDPRTGAVRHLPFDVFDVGFAPDGTALTLVGGDDGQVWLAEQREADVLPLTPLPGLAPIPPTSLPQAVLASGELVAVRELRGRERIAIVVADADTGATVAELVHRRGDLEREFWLDDETMLLARTPQFLMWKPRTGELFRVTSAKRLSNTYWSVTVAP